MGDGRPGEEEEEEELEVDYWRPAHPDEIDVLPQILILFGLLPSRMTKYMAVAVMVDASSGYSGQRTAQAAAKRILYVVSCRPLQKANLSSRTRLPIFTQQQSSRTLGVSRLPLLFRIHRNASWSSDSHPPPLFDSPPSSVADPGSTVNLHQACVVILTFRIPKAPAAARDVRTASIPAEKEDFEPPPFSLGGCLGPESSVPSRKSHYLGYCSSIGSPAI